MENEAAATESTEFHTNGRAVLSCELGTILDDVSFVLKECHLYVCHKLYSSYEIMTVQASFLVFTSPSCTHFPVARFEPQKSSSYYCRRDNCDESIPRACTPCRRFLEIGLNQRQRDISALLDARRCCER